MDVWNYILGYRNTLKSVFETWVVHIPFKRSLSYLDRIQAVLVGKMPMVTPRRLVYHFVIIIFWVIRYSAPNFYHFLNFNCDHNIMHTD